MLMAIQSKLILIDRYFQAGGNHEEMVKLLSENYTGIAQSTNLLANWLIVTGKIHLMSVMLGTIHVVSGLIYTCSSSFLGLNMYCGLYVVL